MKRKETKMTYKNDMSYSEVENLMNALLESDLHFMDRIDWAEGFMTCDVSKEEIEKLIA